MNVNAARVFGLAGVLMLAGPAVLSQDATDVVQAAARSAADERAYSKHLRRAQEREARGSYRAAAAEYRKAAQHAAAADEPGLLLKRADCLRLDGKHYAACEAYEDLITAHPLHPQFGAVTDHLRGLVEDFAGGRASRFGIRNRSKGVEILEFILSKSPAGRKASGDLLRLGQLQTDLGEDAEAAETYRALLKRHPRAKEAGLARLELGRLLLRLGKRGDGDGSLTRQGQRELTIFLRNNPQHAEADMVVMLLAVADERLAERLFQLGQFYLRETHLRVPAARRYLHDVIRDYGETAAAGKAEVLLAQADAAAQDTDTEQGAATETEAPKKAGPEAAAPEPKAPVAVSPATVRTASDVRKLAPEKPLVPHDADGLLHPPDETKKYLLPLRDLRAPK